MESASMPTMTNFVSYTMLLHGVIKVPVDR
jgi:hypothetical protein